MSDFNYEIKANDYYGDGAEKFVPNNPLKRPKIRYGFFIIAVVGFAALILLSYFVASKCIFNGLENKTAYSFVFCVIIALSYCLIIAKKAIIWIVKVYQHYAPDEVRLRCVFEPSCSEYMILAIEKYGLFVGVYKGIRRLLRCQPPGGIDYP